MEDEIRATMEDVAAANFCASGFRKYAKKWGITLKDIKQGVPAERLQKMDAYGKKVAQLARERHGRSK